MGRAGHVTPTQETRGACKVLVGKSGSRRQRWEDSIKVDPARGMPSFVTSTWVHIFVAFVAW